MKETHDGKPAGEHHEPSAVSDADGGVSPAGDKGYDRNHFPAWYRREARDWKDALVDIRNVVKRLEDKEQEYDTMWCNRLRRLRVAAEEVEIQINTFFRAFNLPDEPDPLGSESVRSLYRERFPERKKFHPDWV